jgi:flavin reductase (DIM6/NTAB) family NADH-FMN oxidoreductase RutF
MARLAAGVAVVGVRDSGGFRGMTVTSLTSVSVEPPMVLVCVDSVTATRDAIAETGAFTASILERRQEFLAERFAGRAPQVDPTWREIPHEVTDHGLPVIRGCLAWVECRLQALHVAGDHEIAVGLVESAGHGPGEPLVLWARGFWSLA